MRLIKRTFFNMAVGAGLDTLLVDVRDQALLSATYASKVLVHQDPYGTECIKVCQEKKILV